MSAAWPSSSAGSSAPWPPWSTGRPTRCCLARRASLLSVRVRLGIGAEQGGGIDLGVALGGAERSVAQQFLDRAQIGAGAQQVGGEGMAQSMRRGAVRQAETASEVLHRRLDMARA